MVEQMKLQNRIVFNLFSLKLKKFKIYKTVDYVKFEKGSEHSSYSKIGCKLLVILHGGTNEILEQNSIKFIS